MKAIEFNDYGDANVLQLVEVDAPHPGPDEILIKVHAAGVNPSDWKQREGHYKTSEDILFPSGIGVEGSGIVAKIGAGKQDYLASLGAIPTLYGEGFAERVRSLAPAGIDAAIDVAGSGIIPELIAIVGNAAHVLSVADFSAERYGARFSHGPPTDPARLLAKMAQLCQSGAFTLHIDKNFPLDQTRQAQNASQTGHVKGKLVVRVD